MVAREYQERLEARRNVLAGRERVHRLLGRVNLTLVGVAIAVVLLGGDGMAWWLVPLVVVFAGVVMVHTRVLTARDGARSAVAFYERGMQAAAPRVDGPRRAGRPVPARRPSLRRRPRPVRTRQPVRVAGDGADACRRGDDRRLAASSGGSRRSAPAPGGHSGARARPRPARSDGRGWRRASGGGHPSAGPARLGGGAADSAGAMAARAHGRPVGRRRVDHRMDSCDRRSVAVAGADGAGHPGRPTRLRPDHPRTGGAHAPERGGACARSRPVRVAAPRDRATAIRERSPARALRGAGAGAPAGLHRDRPARSTGCACSRSAPTSSRACLPL